MNVEPWLKPVGLSTPGRRADLLGDLPHGPKALAEIVQGVLMHEHIASTYGVQLDDSQHAEAHVRSVEGILDGIAAHDARALTAARAPDQRQVGVCRHFSLVHVAMLRAQGIPARARCGFGAYFEKGKFYDHWVTEYWNEAGQRWVLVDAQMDPHQRKLFHVGFDPQDVPRDQFLVAGDAWTLCHDGKADPDDFCILDMKGWWFIASNVIRDVAALNGHEMLPWDVWGAMVPDDEKIDRAFIDRLAELSSRPDADPEALRAAYHDNRVAVPPVVFNNVLGRDEPVAQSG
jgi:hypothetical protein